MCDLDLWPGKRRAMCDLDLWPGCVTWMLTPPPPHNAPLSPSPPPPQTEAEACKDHDLKDLLPFGFAIHHAGG